MSINLPSLFTVAVPLGVIHTLLGPDHYLPIAALAGEKKWPLSKTMAMTLFFGFGHILSALLLVLFARSIGSPLFHRIEAVRGGVAGWGFLLAGMTVLLFSFRRRNKAQFSKRSLPFASSVIFTLFVVGPCEPLIPLAGASAVGHSILQVLAISGVFSAATLITMMFSVGTILVSARSFKLERFNLRPGFAVGLTLLACGAAVQFFGL